jgi:hypothetical protein
MHPSPRPAYHKVLDDLLTAAGCCSHQGGLSIIILLADLRALALRGKVKSERQWVKDVHVDAMHVVNITDAWPHQEGEGICVRECAAFHGSTLCFVCGESD